MPLRHFVCFLSCKDILGAEILEEMKVELLLAIEEINFLKREETSVGEKVGLLIDGYRKM